METAQGIVANLPVQPTQLHGRPPRIRKKWADRLQAAIRLAQAAQGFDAGDAAGRGVDERLKTGEGLPIEHMASLVAIEWGGVGEGLAAGSRSTSTVASPDTHIGQGGVC